jgi:hypothetical protein
VYNIYKRFLKRERTEMVIMIARENKQRWTTDQKEKNIES